LGLFGAPDVVRHALLSTRRSLGGHPVLG